MLYEQTPMEGYLYSKHDKSLLLIYKKQQQQQTTTTT